MSIISEKYKSIKKPRREPPSVPPNIGPPSFPPNFTKLGGRRSLGGWGPGTIPTMEELTDDQWELVAPLVNESRTELVEGSQPGVRQAHPPAFTFPEPVEGLFPELVNREAARSLPVGSRWEGTKKKCGRPRADARRVLNGVLYAIRNALTWANIPPEYPSYVTLFRRYHEWLESGVLEQVIYTLTRHLGQVSGLDYEKALGTRRLSFHQQDGILTLYLPQEYSEYWMQPTAALLLMWLVARTLGIYAEAYRRACKEQRLQRLPDQAGPRKSRPREVVIIVGENPEKLKVDKPDLARERMEFMDRMGR